MTQMVFKIGALSSSQNNIGKNSSIMLGGFAASDMSTVEDAQLGKLMWESCVKHSNFNVEDGQLDLHGFVLNTCGVM